MLTLHICHHHYTSIRSQLDVSELLALTVDTDLLDVLNTVAVQ